MGSKKEQDKDSAQWKWLQYINIAASKTKQSRAVLSAEAAHLYTL